MPADPPAKAANGLAIRATVTLMIRIRRVSRIIIQGAEAHAPAWCRQLMALPNINSMRRIMITAEQQANPSQRAAAYASMEKPYAAARVAASSGISVNYLQNRLICSLHNLTPYNLLPLTDLQHKQGP